MTPCDEMAAPDVTHEELRPLLFSLAYRLVGGVGEAEDLVQEAFLRLHRSPEPVVAPKAFLTKVVTRLAIDHLRSARVRREAYVGPWLPEPLVADAAPGPADRVEDDETLSLAFLALLERLSPVERAVYVLHDLFDYGHPEIADMVGKSSANSRQILVRARRHVEQGRPRFEPSRREREALLGRFLDAIRVGDVQALIDLLAADAVSYADGGGKARATRLPIYGAEKVARLWAKLGTDNVPPVLRLADVNGQPGVVGVDADGRVVGVLTLEVAGGQVHSVWAVVNPDKLARVPTASAAAQ
jgi:RNA polymerase sigma-70 factor (ECF subfamily)